MPVLGHVTVPVGGRVITLPVVSFPYANHDSPGAAGGLFVDDAGNLAIAVDATAPQAEMQARIAQGAADAVNALGASVLTQLPN